MRAGIRTSAEQIDLIVAVYEMDRDQTEIASIRELLTSKPRPVGWAERRQRLDEVGAIWPVAEDVALAAVDLGGVPGEWSMAPGSDPSLS